MTSTAKYTKDQVNIALMQEDVKSIKDDVKEIKGGMEAEYVTQTEFKPIRNLVYGTVGLFLTSIGGAFIALILK